VEAYPAVAASCPAEASLVDSVASFVVASAAAILAVDLAEEAIAVQLESSFQANSSEAVGAYPSLPRCLRADQTCSKTIQA